MNDHKFAITIPSCSIHESVLMSMNERAVAHSVRGERQERQEQRNEKVEENKTGGGMFVSYCT